MNFFKNANLSNLVETCQIFSKHVENVHVVVYRFYFFHQQFLKDNHDSNISVTNSENFNKCNVKQRKITIKLSSLTSVYIYF